MLSHAIIDKVSLYYEFILKFLTEIGGDREKQLPSLSFEERKTENENEKSIKKKEDAGESDETFLRFKTEFGSSKDWKEKLQQHINEALIQENLSDKTVATFLDEILETEVETISPQTGDTVFPLLLNTT